MLLYVDDKEVVDNFTRTRLQTDRGHTNYQEDQGKWLNTVSLLLGHSQQQQTMNINELKTDTYNRLLNQSS